jgi:hypothetical protein
MKKALFTFCTILSSFNLYAQNFLWGQSGGSQDAVLEDEQESVRDIATDKNGNVYVIAYAGQLGMHVSGQSIAGRGDRDIMVASFKPDGSTRWVKVIGSSMRDVGGKIATDDKDGVYICCEVDKTSGPCYIDADAISSQNGQRALIIKYDTSGNYQWHHHPEPVTQTSATAVQSIAMDVDRNGNVHWLTLLEVGTYGTGTLIVPVKSVYILKYDASGNFSYKKPQLDISGNFAGQMYMTVDEINHRLYVSGWKGNGVVKFGNVLQNGVFLGAFDFDGNYLWSTSNSRPDAGRMVGRPAIDATGNIYVGAVIRTLDTFNGYTILGPANYNASAIFKIDKNGNNIWARNAIGTGTTTYSAIVALRNNNEVVLTGFYTGSMEWAGYKITTPIWQEWDIFMIRFRSNDGEVLGVDTINNKTASGLISELATDMVGNVYIGGAFDYSPLKINDVSSLNCANGPDWFVIKYGDMWKTDIKISAYDNRMRLYPNPASNILNIVSISSDASYTVTDILGKVLLSGITCANDAIHIHSLAPGMYLINVQQNNIVQTLKFVKN